MSQEKLRNEQIDLERQIKNQTNGRNMEQEERERNEMAYSQAVLESNPNDFSAEHEMSLQAMANNQHSSAAMAVYDH